MNVNKAVATILKNKISLKSPKDLDLLLEAIGNSKYVLLGEASHGTSEFYQWRAQISKRLIEEKGFRFIAVEGDWPDCFEANRYIKGMYDKPAESSRDVLIDSFKRWPTWMWANWEISELLDWMKDFNLHKSPDQQAGFYGLDVYSLYESMTWMMKYVNKLKDPEAREAAQAVVQCFQPYAKDPVKYGRAANKKPMTDSCKKEVITLLKEMKMKYDSTLQQKQGENQEMAFAAQMNSKVLVDAENYYRIMLKSGNESWNVRDDHMGDTLDSLMQFHGSNAKAIIWAHNTHVGDARFTDMADEGMRNLGQIVRQRHAKEDGVFIVGFGTGQGSVIAGDYWDAPWDQMDAPSPPANSWEYLLRDACFCEMEETPDMMLIFPFMKPESRKVFDEMKGHRAIGVVYNPATDRFGHWVPTQLGRRYDSFIYLDKTIALHPLPDEPDLSLQPPETYPFGTLV